MNDRPRISVIIPTLGRTSLRMALESLKRQLLGGDEVLVVGDGPQPGARKIAKKFGESFRYEETEPTNCWGHAQRNLGMELAKGDYLAFLDDDDLSFFGALASMREEIGQHSQKLLIFRMKHTGAVLWKDPELRLNNISSQMYCFPNRPDRLAQWGPNRETPSLKGGDFCFARDTACLWPSESVIFCHAIVAILDKHRDGQVEEPA